MYAVCLVYKTVTGLTALRIISASEVGLGGSCVGIWIAEGAAVAGLLKDPSDEVLAEGFSYSLTVGNLFVRRPGFPAWNVIDGFLWNSGF